MKVIHWTAHAGSGMNAVAELLCTFEKKLGLDSRLANPLCPTNGQHSRQYEEYYDVDIHVEHTFLPNEVRRHAKRSSRVVYVAHGTPEHVFQGSVESCGRKPYGMSDSWMLLQYSLQHSDGIVTFWPRHAELYRTLCDKKTTVSCFPLGVDTSFWKPTPSRGPFEGKPVLFHCENCHYIKWPLDLFLAWPLVYPRVEPNPSLHVVYFPMDLHRWFFPLVNRNGSSYACHITSHAFSPEDLRNAFCSVDYQIGLVRYGDFNCVSLQANACGANTISYRGNPYASHWVTEGDQRVLAEELVAILNGKVEPRKDREKVPDASITAQEMKSLYESLL